jgi:hypothetical protein
MPRTNRIDDPIFADLNARRIWDFQFDFAATAGPAQFDVLTILGSTDFSYYHNAEIRFFDVRYISCPTYFSHALFGIASSSDSERLQAVAIIDDTRLFCVTVEAESSDECDHFIAASRVEVTIKDVAYSQDDSTGA